MANLNKVMLIGRLSFDPEPIQVNNNTVGAKFRFVVNNRRPSKTNPQQWEDVPVYIDVEIWNRGENKGNSFASTSAELSRALRRNPHLRVLVASGRYDLGTPYSASDWSLAQLDAPADVLKRVTHRYYDAGHMMYTRSADLKQLKADLAAWLD